MSRASRLRPAALTAVLVLCAALACRSVRLAAGQHGAPGASEDDGSGSGRWFEDGGADRFVGHDGPRERVAFGIAAADMDGDDDLDLLINWHHLQPIELFENRAGTLHLIPTAQSGLSDVAGIPDYYAPLEAMHERLRGAVEPGLYLWHDLDRGGWWRFYWHPGQDGGADLSLSTSIEFATVQGLRETEYRRPSAERLEIELPAGRSVPFAIRCWLSGVVLNVHARRGERGVPLWVGPALTSAGEGRVQLWMNDPHGVAWVDVEGDAAPELAITRGALAGILVPPMEPKRDQFFRPTAQGPTRYRNVSPQALPADHGRGRRVEWVQADGDAALELSISRKASPNGLLDLRPGGQADAGQAGGGRVDVADQRGLALEGGEVLAWADHDGDGRDDAFVLADSRIDVYLQTDSGPYRALDGSTLGLDLGASSGSSRIIERTALHWLDFDADGGLDLLLTGDGEAKRVRLFRREGAGGSTYTEVTEALGLGAAAGRDLVVPIDADGDRFVDLAAFGEDLILWHNLAGRRFEPRRVELPARDLEITAATAIDLDGDGRDDLIAVGRERFYLRNVTTAARDWIDVHLPNDDGPAPVGALVVARYDDGRLLAQRLGSAGSTAFSQTTRPLRFPVPSGVTLEAISVRWPGEREHRPLDLPGEGRRLRATR